MESLDGGKTTKRLDGGRLIFIANRDVARQRKKSLICKAGY